MKTATKIWLIAAAALVLVGTTIFAGVMTVLNWDFSKLSTDRYQTKEYTINEDFRSIAVVTDTADIDFIPSEECRVVCYEPENAAHTVQVEEGTLAIKVEDRRKWYEHIGISIGAPKIAVYLPEGIYEQLSVSSQTGRVDIPADYAFTGIFVTESTGHVTCLASVSENITVKATTGSIRIENLTAGQLDLSVSTGKIHVSGVDCKGDVNVSVSTGDADLTDLTCKNLITNGSTGDIALKNVVASEKFTITRTTGDVKFDGCDASALSVTTSTGNVTGTLLSEKVFIADTDTGSVRVPRTATGGRCEITTGTGSIKIDVE